MKKIYSLLLLGGLLLFGAQSLMATDIRNGGTMYVRNLNNAGISGLWKIENGYIRVCLRTSSGTGDTWVSAEATPVYGSDNTEGAVYQFTIPSGTWKYVLLTRGATNSYQWGENKWNNTGEIEIPADGNLLVSYSENNNNGTWINYDASSTATNWYLNSTSGEWSSVQFMKATAEATTASVTVSVTSLFTDLEFYIQSAASGATLKKNVTMTPINNGPLSFNTDDNNAKFKSTVAGSYTFTLNLTNNQVTLTYPTAYSRADITEAGIWGTICLPVDGEISDATLYSIVGKFGGKLYVTSEGTTLTAGMPYLFKSTASAPSVVLANTAYVATPLSEGHTTNGLYGRYTDQSFEGWNSSTIYVVRNEEIQKAKTGTGAGNFSGIYANRAFIEMNRVPNLGSAPSAPAMHFVIDESNGATSVDAIEASKKAVKFIENGKLFIQKNGVIYDTTGRVVR